MGYTTSRLRKVPHKPSQPMTTSGGALSSPITFSSNTSIESIVVVVMMMMIMMTMIKRMEIRMVEWDVIDYI